MMGGKYKYARDNPELKQKLLFFTSAKNTARHTSHFLENGLSMVLIVLDQIANACRAQVLKFSLGPGEEHGNE